MSKEVKASPSTQIAEFLKEYQNYFLREGSASPAYSAVLFAYLVKGESIEMVVKGLPSIVGDMGVDDGPSFSDVDFSVMESAKWKDNVTLHSVLTALDPLMMELYFMWSIIQQGFISKYKDLFAGEAYSQLIEAAIKWGDNSDRSRGEFLQPSELTEFMLALADPAPGSTMYNPFAGMASFGLMAHADIHYLGQELNPRVWALGTIRLSASRDPKQTVFTCADSIAEWAPAGETFQTVIANPPLGTKHPIKESSAKGLLAYDAFFLDSAVTCLSDDGKALCVVAPRLLFSSNNDERALRRKLVETDLLDMIVSLPGGVLSNTSVPVVIVVLNKAKALPGQVRFVNGVSFGKQGRRNAAPLDHSGLLKAMRESKGITEVVPNSVLEKNEWSLDPKRYFITEQFQGEPLSKYLTPYKGKVVKKGATGRMIRIRDLKSDVLDYRLLADQPHVELTSNCHSVDRPVLLVALRWSALKPTLFDGSRDPVLIPSDLAAFEFDQEQVDSDYLIQRLLAPSTVEQAALYRTGFTVPTLSAKDFLSIRIVVPTPEEQRKRALDVRLTILNESHEKVVQLRESLGVGKLRHEENTFLRHSIAGPFSNLRFNQNELRDFLMDAIASESPITIFDKIRSNEKETLADILNSLDSALELMAIELQRHGKEDMEMITVPLTPLSVYPLLEEYKNHYRAAAFSFEVEYDPGLIAERSISKLVIDTDRGLLFKLLDNLVDNAVSHAFEKMQTKRDVVHIHMTKRVDETGDFVVLNVSNTGHPFAKGFDKEKFIRKNFKGGSSKGDGYGGHLVNTIVDRMNGSFELLAQPEDRRFATTFQFSFPISG